MQLCHIGFKTVSVFYEVDKFSRGAVTRTLTYYPAGGALRIDSTVYYVLRDHPSTSSGQASAQPWRRRMPAAM